MSRSGKRIRSVRRLAVLAAVALLLFSGQPDGAAVYSPAEDGAQPLTEVSAELPCAVAERAPLQTKETGTGIMPEEHVPEEAASESGAETAEFLPAPWNAAVPESEAVEDTYFETAAFLGDSRTEGFRLYSGLDFGSYYYAVGATVESVFTKAVETAAGEMPLLDAMAEGTFDKIYVMLGINELGWKGTELFYGQYAALIDRLRQDHPDAEIVLQSILPVGLRQEEKGGYVNNRRIEEYNEVIRLLAAEKACWHLELGPVVSDETGLLREDWSYDGVHLNGKGCRAWLEELRTHPVPPGAE